MPAVAHGYFEALHQSLESQYTQCDCESCQNTRIELSKKEEKNDFKGLLKTFEKAFKTLFEKKGYKPDDLLKVPEFKSAVEETARAFSSAISYDVPKEMKAYLEKDAFVFSGLKTHTQLTEARSFLKDEKGNIVPFYKFQEKISKLNEKYNKNYLETEYNFAVRSAQSAASWANHQDDETRYLMEYRVTGINTRPSHQAMSGICLPKSDPFWQSFYPPNGWECHCWVVDVLAREKTRSDSQKAMELGNAATTQIGKTGKNKLAMFRFNAGMDKKLFPPNNTYSKVVGADIVKKELDRAIKTDKISEDNEFTPKEISKYEENLGVKIDRRIFEHLQKETPLLFTNPEGITGSGAYYSPYYNAVKIPIDNRRKASKWYAEAVVYHEFGHAADNHIGLKQSPIVIELMNKHIKSIDFKAVDERVAKFGRYASRRGNHDLIEKVGAVRDTIMSLNPNYGMGHTKAYYKQAGNRQAEFIAHAFENTYAGNNVFKKVLPELYEDMIKLIEETKPK